MNYDTFAGDGPHCLVLLHGHGLNRSYFRPLCRDLEKHRIRYINVDLPGYGFARDVDCKGYDEIVDYVRGILDAEHVETCVPVGYSYGGFISLALNTRLQERVKGLVLMASSYEISIRTLRPFFVAAHFPICTLINEICWLRYKEGQQDFDFARVAVTDSDLRMVRHSSVATTRANMLKNAKIMSRHSLLDDVRAVRVPTLIIQPRRCQFFSCRAYDFLAATIPNATRIFLGTTHNIAPAWDTVATQLREFLPRCV